MFNNLVPFAFDDVLVRVLNTEQGEPLFVAKDVCHALDYTWAGIRNVQHVPDEWRRVESVSTLRRGAQEMLCLTEQGLYFFLARSDKPKALPFQKWLSGEVLPAIRKTGQYDWQRPKLPERPRLALEALPEEVGRLKPRLRERCLDLAMQMARLTGLTDAAAIHGLFVDYCLLLGGGGSLFSPKTEAEAAIVDFIKTHLTPKADSRLYFNDIYKAFRHWWRDGRADLIPSQKALALVLGDYYQSRKSNRMLYYGVAFAG